MVADKAIILLKSSLMTPAVRQKKGLEGQIGDVEESWQEQPNRSTMFQNCIFLPISIFSSDRSSYSDSVLLEDIDTAF